MITITEEEEAQLRYLYDKANEEDTPAALNDIRVYYRTLGKKYKFNPLRVTINTKGEVRPITKENVWVVYNTDGILLVTRNRIKALELVAAPNVGYNMKEIPLE